MYEVKVQKPADYYCHNAGPSTDEPVQAKLQDALKTKDVNQSISEDSNNRGQGKAKFFDIMTLIIIKEEKKQ